MMAFISCKHKEHITLKEVVDPQPNTHSKILKIGKMYKDKWNYINSDYKKIFDYYKGIGHDISY